MGITCSDIDGALRTCHNRVQHCIAREARRAGVHVMVEVFGAFTRALRDAALEKCEEYFCAGILAGRDRGSCPICRSAQLCTS